MKRCANEVISRHGYQMRPLPSGMSQSVFMMEQVQALIQGEEKERRRAEEAEKYRKNLEDFINMVCHEIRNPRAANFDGTDSRPALPYSAA